MPDANDVGRSITRALRLLVVATVVLYLLVIAVAVRAYHDADVSRGALCALREDLEKRVASSKDFLIENPGGIAGIPAKTIRDGIKNQERTIKALDGLSC